jgi:lipoprotein-anchoring transpeptidase ErfK/SrfK
MIASSLFVQWWQVVVCGLSSQRRLKTASLYRIQIFKLLKIRIDTENQKLELLDESRLVRRYPVSTAINGVGEVSGSFCTPRGRHVVRARIGAGLPENTVFVRRRPSGEVYTDELGSQFPERDWILSRILWLSGCEPGFNRLGKVDTMRRYIYIHGTPHEDAIGRPASHGCVRMRMRDMVELFELVPVGTPVEIV